MALYELMEYWNYLNLAEEDIARHLIRSVERHLARRYARAYDGFGDLKVAPLTQLQLLVCDFMLSDCGFTAARETLLLYAVQMAANTKDETARLGTLYHLGILYFDMMKLDDSERCYEEVIECSSKRAAESQDMLEQLARCCNAMGLLKKLRREYDEARRYLQLSKEHHSKRAVGIHGVKVDLAITWMNIGACYFDEGFNEDALENLEKAKELYDECFFGTMTHDKLSVWNNMAICYRRMGRLDDALKLQHKCLEGRLDMFGHKHPDVVESYMNIAVVYQVKEQYEDALELSKKALDLATTLFPPHHLRVSQLQENMALVLYIMGRVDESEEWLFKAADAMTTAGTWASCLITLHGKFISSYINEQNDGKLLKLLVPLMQTKYVQGGHYNLLDVTRKRLGLEAIPGAEDLTLEHGLQRFPGNDSILGYMTATLADEGKLDEMRRFLLKEQRQPSLFASLCNNYFQDARVHEVLVSAWLSQHPDDPAALAQADVVAQRTAQSEASSDK